jgi:hypothetical protein
VAGRKLSFHGCVDGFRSAGFTRIVALLRVHRFWWAVLVGFAGEYRWSDLLSSARYFRHLDKVCRYGDRWPGGTATPTGAIRTLGRNVIFLGVATSSRSLRVTRRLYVTAVENIGEKLAPSAVMPDATPSNDLCGIRRSR